MKYVHANVQRLYYRIVSAMMWLLLFAITAVNFAGQIGTAAGDLDNCMDLDDGLRLWWSLDMEAEVATFRICGCVTLQESVDNQYNGFGLSGSSAQTLMLGADAVITWVDDDSGPHAEDYYLNDYLQCRTSDGVCPDTDNIAETCTNDIFDISGSKENGTQCVTYSRPFVTNDSICDRSIDPANMNQYIVWSVGGLGETAFKHFKRADADDPPIHFGRTPADKCSSEPLRCNECDAFSSKSIVALESATFVVQIGPPAGGRGYMGITGRAGWGYAWYINDSLIPELTVQRGSEYTFITEGGSDTTNLGMYHPFYITSSIGGGRLCNTPATQALYRFVAQVGLQCDRISTLPMQAETVYGGFDDSGDPLGVGRFCELKPTALASDFLFHCGSRELYEENLYLDCNPGESGMFTWIPDEYTPDLVYYQCATHLNFGWKIHVTGGQYVGDRDDEMGGATVAMASWSVLLLIASFVTLTH